MKFLNAQFHINHPFSSGYRNRRGLIKKHLRSAILIICFGAGLSSCFLHYYKTNRANTAEAAMLQDLVTKKKYFILHNTSGNYAFSHLQVVANNLEGDIDILPPVHSLYLHPRNDYANRFKALHKEIVTQEVHLYTKKEVALQSRVSIPLADFVEMDVYEVDQVATSKSKTLSIVGLSALTAGIVALVIIASSEEDKATNPTPQPEPTTIETCSPEVYWVKGDESRLTGIFYSGAIFAPLQRTDYLPLQGIEPVNGQFSFQIKGGKNEELFIRDTRLLQVTSDAENHVLPDRHGKIMVYRDPQTPGAVYTGEDRNMRTTVGSKDEQYYSFTNEVAGDKASSIELDFEKPVAVASGKLLVSAKNSQWGRYIFKQFKSLYGDHYQEMVQRKDRADGKKLLQCEQDQSLPLSVYIKENGQWKFVDYFLTPGNELNRDMIMEIDLSGLRNKTHCQLRLETTYMFWDLDYAAMDFSEGLSCTSSYISAAKQSTTGENLSTSLAGTGTAIHLAEQERLNIDFTVSNNIQPGKVSAYFLVGTGYYHDNTVFEGKPQLGKLAAFSKKGAFDQFSRQTFDELLSSVRSSKGAGLVIRN